MNHSESEQQLPSTCLPSWSVKELPEPKPLGWRNLLGFIGPGIVMCGIQIGGGEWLFGPGITARYGGGLMWIATVAILVQVFYNIECGRYALYCGEPVFTGFMRTRPGPAFWVGVVMVMSIGALIPGLSTNAAVLITAMYLNQPPSAPNLSAGSEMVLVVTDNDGTRTTTRGRLAWSEPENAKAELLEAAPSAPLPLRISRVSGGLMLTGTAPPGGRVELRRSEKTPLYDQHVKPVTVDTGDYGIWTVTLRDDSFLVNVIAYICLGVVVLPVLIGGKVYNMLQVVMTAKVFAVLAFCAFIGLFFVSWQGWIDVFSGFLKFGNMPVSDGQGGEKVVNVVGHYLQHGEWPILALGNIALLGAFAGYAGGGGLSNATYSNFVRDKGWGMGSQVGAIASAVGGRNVTLSHIGSVFELTEDNLRKWRAWWKYIITDQAFIWGPGCFMGMALPALISIQFSRFSPMFGKEGISYSQPLIAADGIRNCSELSGTAMQALWLIALVVGLMVFLPSQMSIVEDFARRWTDMIWSGSRHVRERWKSHQVKHIFYAIIAVYVLWTFISATIFLTFGNAPTLMVTVIANLNNVGIGFTAFHVLWVNRRMLPPPLRPRWYSQLGIACCGVFYLGLATLVFIVKIVPLITG